MKVYIYIYIYIYLSKNVSERIAILQFLLFVEILP